MAVKTAVSAIKIPSFMGGFTKGSSLSNDFYIEEIRSYTELEKKLMDDRRNTILNMDLNDVAQKNHVDFIDSYIEYIHENRRRTHENHAEKESSNQKNNKIFTWGVLGVFAIDALIHLIVCTQKK